MEWTPSHGLWNAFVILLFIVFQSFFNLTFMSHPVSFSWVIETVTVYLLTPLTAGPFPLSTRNCKFWAKPVLPLKSDMDCVVHPRKSLFGCQVTRLPVGTFGTLTAPSGSRLFRKCHMVQRLCRYKIEYSMPTLFQIKISANALALLRPKPHQRFRLLAYNYVFTNMASIAYNFLLVN